jgi:hypothetical protein
LLSGQIEASGVQKNLEDAVAEEAAKHPERPVTTKTGSV